MSELVVALVLGGLLGVAVIVTGLWASRRRTLTRRVGSFECGLAMASPRGQGGSAGTCQYGATRLYWWRGWSLSPRPARIWPRSQIVIVERVLLDDVRATGHVAVRCRTDDESFELVMTREAYAGFRSWIEAAPPAVHELV